MFGGIGPERNDTPINAAGYRALAVAIDDMLDDNGAY
jgi:hypothetical protein